MNSERPTTEEIAKNVAKVYRILQDAAPEARPTATLELARDITVLAVNLPFGVHGQREPAAKL